MITLGRMDRTQEDPPLQSVTDLLLKRRLVSSIFVDETIVSIRCGVARDSLRARFESLPRIPRVAQPEHSDADLFLKELRRRDGLKPV